LNIREIKFQEAVIFLEGGYLIAVKSGRDGMIYVAVPHICEQLGLDLDREEAAIRDRADLWWGHRALRVWTPPGSLSVQSCLRSDLISTWLDGAAGVSPNPDKLRAFQKITGDAAQTAFDASGLPGMPAGAWVGQTVSFDEPPPPDIVAKLRRLADSLRGTAGISPESIERLSVLVAEAERLNATKGGNAGDKLVSEVNRVLGIDRDRA
jgi:hypothetical protein